MTENQAAPDPLREALTALADEWERDLEPAGDTLRALLDAHPAPEGVTLTEAERASLVRHQAGQGGDLDLWICFDCEWEDPERELGIGGLRRHEAHADAVQDAAVERILAARQAPTVALDV